MITLDFETRSHADITKVGSWVYSEDRTTDVICLCWAVGDGQVQEWWPSTKTVWPHPTGDFIPDDLCLAIKQGGLFEAHNYAFEHGIWQNVMVKRYGWPEIPLESWRCTQAVAQYYALPSHLNGILGVLGGGGKDHDGGRLITKYSKLYLKTAKEDIPEVDFRKFVDYCKKDVELERKLSNFLGPLPDAELAIFQMDKKINTRGMYLDLGGIEDAAYVVDTRKDELTEQFTKRTGLKPKQTAAVKKWFETQGLELDNLQKEYLIEKLAEGDNSLPDEVSEVLSLRIQVAGASTDKLKAMVRQRSEDGTAKFQCKYHGAVTGRWTGTGIQPLNLSRGYEDVDPEQLVRDIRQRDPQHLDTIYGSAIECVGKASRHWIKAKPGHRLIAGDFVSIEAVILACLAGEEWKVNAFRHGAKIYELTGDKIYKLPEGTVSKATHPMERQDGKTCELAFGYQGGVSAWRNFDKSDRHTDEAIEGHRDTWRATHPAICDRKNGFWANLNTAAFTAINEGEKAGYIPVEGPSGIAFARIDEWLTMLLPNGKNIWYYAPELRLKMPAWHTPKKEGTECFEGKCNHEPILNISYLAQKLGSWGRQFTYGGKLAENATQATSREVLVPAMQRLEAAGYPIILSVYDEIVCEVPDGHGSVEEFQELLSIKPYWCADWPIGVDCWEGQRYKK